MFYTHTHTTAYRQQDLRTPKWGGWVPGGECSKLQSWAGVHEPCEVYEAHLQNKQEKTHWKECLLLPLGTQLLTSFTWCDSKWRCFSYGVQLFWSKSIDPGPTLRVLYKLSQFTFSISMRHVLSLSPLYGWRNWGCILAFSIPSLNSQSSESHWSSIHSIANIWRVFDKLLFCVRFSAGSWDV